MRRRRFLASPIVLLATGALAADEYPRVVAGSCDRVFRATPARTRHFAASGGTSPAGFAMPTRNQFGVQVTFFRNRPRVAESNPSAFAPRQLLFAHAAIADPRHGRLRHDQRAARAGFELAGAAEETTAAWIDDWSLKLVDGVYVATIAARDFRFDLRFAPAQPVLLEGDRGFSRKGRSIENASYYYSQPQLARLGQGRDRRQGRGRHRHRLARSRMVERGAGARSQRLGLDRHQPRRRRRADGVPHARSFGRGDLGGRHVSRARSGFAIVRARRNPVHARSGAGARRAPASSTRSRCGSARAAKSTRWNR